jgi:hypothetical protein
VRFTGPEGLRVAWFAPTADGRAGFGPQFLEAPGRYNFLQGGVYRLKLSNIPHRPGVDLYPTLEVVPTNAKTAAFLAHSSVPVTFTEDDFQQVADGNFLVKVIYLPDPQFQDLAATGVDEVISSRLEPGVDPIAEAHRRGSILLVVRMGNIDLELPNSPAMDAPGPYGAGAGGMACPPGMPGGRPLPAGPGVSPPAYTPPAGGVLPPPVPGASAAPPPAPGAPTGKADGKKADPVAAKPPATSGILPVLFQAPAPKPTTPPAGPSQ